MELNDKEFDAAFREKVFDAEPQFEEAAWNKMEQKLRRRDRVVFFKKAAALSLVLLLAFGGYLISLNDTPQKSKSSIVRESKTNSVPPAIDQGQPVPETDSAAAPVKVYSPLRGLGNIVKQERTVYNVKERVETTIVQAAGLPAVVRDSLPNQNPVTNPVILPDLVSQRDSTAVASRGSDVEPNPVSSIVKKKKSKERNRLPVSLSFSVGPEFNSSTSMIGGKKGFSTGIGLSLGVTKRIRLQTGLKYSSKDYGTDGYAYAFANEKMKSLISHVDASCDVLEIPLLASFTIMEDRARSIDFNAGMSSYFMLKEDYIFKYTAASGYADRFQEINNKNQHYFGVIDLSATYYIKLKKEKFRLGLEPYVKIPVTGVGEGDVNLKSSGVALKLRYDVGKKSK
ncbi:hypothetical protein [Pedobacter nyackensis]|uniref:hypothetical protein n=1 Tax=Pedobacter nyackensis TaxID=475255 RepID=UPI00292E0910|nr:hypothetical protein [Pedobacter nyackensis]